MVQLGTGTVRRHMPGNCPRALASCLLQQPWGTSLSIFSFMTTLVPFLFCGKAPWAKVIPRRMSLLWLMAPDGKSIMCVRCGRVGDERSQLQPHTESRGSELDVGHSYEHLTLPLQWHISSSKYWCHKKLPENSTINWRPSVQILEFMGNATVSLAFP